MARSPTLFRFGNFTSDYFFKMLTMHVLTNTENSRRQKANAQHEALGITQRRPGLRALPFLF